MHETTNDAGAFERDAWSAYCLIGQYLVASKTEMRRAASRAPGAPAAHHVHAIIHIFRNEGQTVTALAGALGVTRGRASRLADELVGAGLIDRRRDESDRRIVHLWLTERARSASVSVFSRHGEPIRRALAPLDAAGRAAAIGFLERLVAEQAARAEAPADDPGARMPRRATRKGGVATSGL